ncbi:hypothetical protein [Komagataeibacter europaeus]|nr:hypothetical protein [Komagataeibacter europaeus]
MPDWVHDPHQWRNKNHGRAAHPALDPVTARFMAAHTARKLA